MKKFLESILFVFLLFIQTGYSQTLTMGYRESERFPLIGNSTDNSGLYYDLFSTAAKKMNVKLEIVRLPKKRILKRMKEGKIDFYPGFTFTEERTKFVYYLENGLPGGNIGISFKSLPPIKNLNQLKGKRVLAALGGPSESLFLNIEGVNVNTVPKLNIKKAIELLRRGRHDFYIYNPDSIKYYLRKNNIVDIKIHPNCCGNDKPMYLAFSKQSKHFKEFKNLNFNNKKQISITNLPTTVLKDSLAYKLKDTLQRMKESGEIQKIYNKYYK